MQTLAKLGITNSVKQLENKHQKPPKSEMFQNIFSLQYCQKGTCKSMKMEINVTKIMIFSDNVVDMATPQPSIRWQVMACYSKRNIERTYTFALSQYSYLYA